MRKTLILFIVFLAISFISVNLLFCAGPIAKIFSVNGDVSVKKANTNSWIKGEVGMVLNQGDSVRTGKASEAEVSFDPGSNKNVIKLAENTTVLLANLDNKLKVIKLSSGKVFSLVNKLARGAKFEIRTPTAVAGARGTGWSAEVLANLKGAEFAAYLNNIYVQSFGKDGAIIDQKTLEQGFKAFVAEFEKIGAFEKLSEEEKAIWEQWKADFTSRLQERGAGEGGSVDEITQNTEEQQQIEDDLTEVQTMGESGMETFHDRSQKKAGGSGPTE